MTQMRGATEADTRVVVACDMGSAYTSVTYIVFRDGKHEVFDVANWENAPCNDNQPGNEKTEVPTCGYMHDGKLEFGYLPPDSSIPLNNTVWGMKAHFDKKQDSIWQSFNSQITKLGLNADNFVTQFSQKVWDHTVKEMENQDVSPESIVCVVFTIPASFMSPACQEKVQELHSPWPLKDKGAFMYEIEATIHSVYHANSQLQKAASETGGVYVAGIDAGGMIMNFGAYHIQTWTISGITHTVIRQLVDPTSVNAGTEYIKFELMKRAPGDHEPMFQKFLNQRKLADITYNQKTISGNQIGQWEEKFYGEAAESFRKGLSDLAKKAEDGEFEIPFIIFGGGSSNSEFFSNKMRENFKNTFPSAGILKPSRRANVNSRGAILAWSKFNAEDAQTILKHSNFGFLAGYTIKTRRKKHDEFAEQSMFDEGSTSSFVDEDRLYVLKKYGQDFREISNKILELYIDFDESASEQTISEAIQTLAVTPCYFPGNTALCSVKHFWDSIPGKQLRKGGVDMAAIDLQIPLRTSNELAREVVKGLGRHLTYEVQIQIRASNHLYLKVTSRGACLSEVHLQLATDPGSGRFILVPWTSQDPTNIYLDFAGERKASNPKQQPKKGNHRKEKQHYSLEVPGGRIKKGRVQKPKLRCRLDARQQANIPNKASSGTTTTLSLRERLGRQPVITSRPLKDAPRASNEGVGQLGTDTASLGRAGRSPIKENRPANLPVEGSGGKAISSITIASLLDG